jgi:hypothetical protein
MNPVTHGLLSWGLGNCADIGRRGRIVVTIAGLAPDVDGFGYPFELLTRNSANPLDWFHRYHHHLTHNLLAVLAIGVVAWACCRWSWRVLLLATAAAMLHLVCDFVGARGPADLTHPDGDPWPIPLWQPFSDVGYSWSGQWGLASWQNASITVALLVAAAVIAVRRGWSPVELVSRRADAVVVGALRARFGRAAAAQPPESA